MRGKEMSIYKKLSTILGGGLEDVEDKTSRNAQIVEWTNVTEICEKQLNQDITQITIQGGVLDGKEFRKLEVLPNLKSLYVYDVAIKKTTPKVGQLLTLERLELVGLEVSLELIYDVGKLENLNHLRLLEESA